MVTAKLTGVIGRLSGQVREHGLARAQNAKVQGIRTAAAVAENRLIQAAAVMIALRPRRRRGMFERRQIRPHDRLCILHMAICISD